MKALHEMGVAELGAALAAKAVSSVEVTTHLLARVAAHEQLGAMLCGVRTTVQETVRPR